MSENKIIDLRKVPNEIILAEYNNMFPVSSFNVVGVDDLKDSKVWRTFIDMILPYNDKILQQKEVYYNKELSESLTVISEGIRNGRMNVSYAKKLIAKTYEDYENRVSALKNNASISKIFYENLAVKLQSSEMQDYLDGKPMLYRRSNNVKFLVLKDSLICSVNHDLQGKFGALYIESQHKESFDSLIDALYNEVAVFSGETSVDDLREFD